MKITVIEWIENGDLEKYFKKMAEKFVGLKKSITFATAFREMHLLKRFLRQ